jgi:hypothetical protein
MPFHDHRTMAACTCTGVAVPSGRRNFMRLAALGAGAALMGLAPRLASAGQTDALLLSCMDYRLVDDITRYMDGRGMANKYDHIILAGASLGAVTSKFPAWNQTFWEHLDVAIKLHHIHKVFVMDHRDCGAYRVVFNYDYAQDRSAERKIHAETLHALRAAIQQRHEGIKEVELLLMGLDGKVETVEI